MSSGSRLALVALLVLGLGVACVGVLLVGPGAAQDAPQIDGEAESPTGSNSTMLIDLDSNGDAHWTVSYAFDLETEHEREAFREMASEFEAGEIDQIGFEAFEASRAMASQATGRPMELRDRRLRSSPDAQIENGTGLLQMEFTWTNFAVRDNDTLQMGDAFNTTGGTWMPDLGPNQRLLVSPPSGGGVIDANVPARGDGTLVWEGPRDLDSDLLAATFTVRDSSAGFPLFLVLVLTPLLAAAVVLAYVASRYPGRLPDPRDAVSSEDASDSSDSPTTTDGTVLEGAGPAASESAASTDDVDVDLLSDEERVERLLEQNGGRMKQANIVKETGWSNAKVSQLLSAMEEDGQIDKLRIGRENLISFPDQDLTGEE